MPEGSSPRAELARDLDVRHASAVVVGTVIGSGIFLVPADMVQAVGSSAMVYAVWVIGGALSLLGAMAYAELGAMKPAAGGEYVYIRDAYGPLAGFLNAWSWFLIAKPGSMATIAAGMMRLLGTLAPFGFLNQTVIGGLVPLTWAQLCAVGVVIFISFINYIGVRRAGEFQVFFTVLKLAIILGVIGVAFSYGGGSFSHFTSEHAGATGGVAGFMVALVAALWAYDGWNNVNMVAGEIRRPERNLPIALLAGVGTVAALYILMNAAVQYVMPAGAIAASGGPAAAAVRIVLGMGAAAIFTGAMGFQMLATINGTALSGARIPFAVSRDGYFFTGLAHVDPRFRTPANAIIFQGVLAIVMVLLVGGFSQLFSITIFAEWLFYMIATSTIFIFRRREPQAPRPYRAWGYPVMPALFILAAAVLLYYTFIANLKVPLVKGAALGPPLNSLSAAGAMIILAGVPVFYYFAGRRRPRA